MKILVGVDVGGTNTDAAALDSTGIIQGKAKVLTSTVDLTGSVCAAITEALNQVAGSQPGEICYGTLFGTESIFDSEHIISVYRFNKLWPSFYKETQINVIL